MTRPLATVLGLSLLALPTGAAAEDAWLPGRPVGVEAQRGHPRRFVVLSAVRLGTALFDAWTTHRALSRHPGAIEGNPFLRPFARHPATLYGAMATLAAVQLWAADQRLHRGESWTWIPLVGASASGAVAIMNLRF